MQLIKMNNNLNDIQPAAIAGNAVTIGNITKASPDIRCLNLVPALSKLTMSAQICQEAQCQLQQHLAPLKKADGMAAELNNMQQTWTDKIKFMDRHARRAYKRQFWALAKQFKAYCTKNGINYTIQK